MMPMPPEPPLVSILIATRDRPEALLRCLTHVARQDYERIEVVVFDDASTMPSGEAILRQAAGTYPLRMFRAGTRQGVAGARNRLAEAAAGEVLLFLDDDAWLPGPKAVTRAVEAFERHPRAGALAFCIHDERPRRRALLTPHTRAAVRRRPSLLQEPHRVSHYLGGGHALLRSAADEAGPYASHLQFGEEELDRSYRLLEAGYEIWYVPDVTVRHRPPAAHGSDESARQLYHHVRNRLYLAWRYLPARYLPTYASYWLLRYGARALRNGHLRAYLGGLVHGLAALADVPRTPLSPATCLYLRRHHGRRWW